MSIAGGITFQGMGSGTDFAAMIKKLKEIESIPLTRLEKWKADWNKRIDAFDDIINTMSELQSKTDSLTKIDNMIKKTGSTSNETIASVVADPSANPGTHTIEVLQLASAATMASKNIFKKGEDGKFPPLLPKVENPENPETPEVPPIPPTEDGGDVPTAIDDDTDVPPAGGEDPETPEVPDKGENYFEYTYGTGDKAKTVKIVIDDKTTIEDLVKRINNDSKNPGVKASLISNGSGYLFQLQGKETGSEKTLAIDTDIQAFNTPEPTHPIEGETTPGVIDKDDWNMMQAKDAKFIVNGFKDQELTSSSNTVKGVIDGVTINLKNVTEKDKPLNITISTDTSELKGKVTEWVDSVNQLRLKIQSLTAVDPNAKNKDPNGQGVNSQLDADIGSVLTGNYAVQLLSTRLNSIVTSAAFGFSSDKPVGDALPEFSVISQLGISTNVEQGSKDYGMLVIDEEILDDAIKNNPESIAKLIGASTGEAKSDNFIFSSATSSVKPGKYDVKYATNAEGIIDPETVFINGAKASTDPDFPGRYTVSDDTNAAFGISIQFTPGILPANTTFEQDSVSMLKGKGVELNDFFGEEIRNIASAENNGGIPIVKNNYEDIVKGIDKKIIREQERIAQWEMRQKAKYARLDALLAKQQAIMSGNASALAQANIGNKT